MRAVTSSALRNATASEPPPTVPVIEARLQPLAASLVERWAPTFVQDTSSDYPEGDRPLAIDFDGDWIATNNWGHLEHHHRHAPATVYGSAVLTSTHAFLTYTLFYPRDWASPLCLPYVCHDNDLEVLAVVVRLGASASDGSLVFVESKAHTSYVARGADELELDSDGRPFVRVESQGHGMYPVLRGELEAIAGQPRFVAPGARSGGGEPASARSALASDAEPYALASLRDTLWTRRGVVPDSGLWASGAAGSHEYAGRRFGRRGLAIGVLMANVHYPGGVRPPWSLHPSGGERGDWFLDPAAVAAARHAHWMPAAATSLDYVFNPFIADLAAECSGAACPPPPAPRPAPTRTASLWGGTLALLAWLGLRVRRGA